MPLSPPPVHVYVRTHCVHMLGTVDKNVDLVWCAAEDFPGDPRLPELVGSAAKPNARYRIFQVAGMDPYGKLIPPGPGHILVPPTDVFLPPPPPTRHDREETGYGWAPLTASIPNYRDGKLVETGLYAIQVRWKAPFQEDLWQWGELGLASEADYWPLWVHNVAYFVIRRKTEDRRILLCYPFSTGVAYSPPGARADAAESASLYGTEFFGRRRRVSLDRPLRDMATNVLPVHALEVFIRKWAASRGRPPGILDVCTSFELHSDPTLLAAPLALLVNGGHDEYWSKEMVDFVRSFVAGGGNFAALTGNTCWWLVRFEADVRTMTCHKSGVEDPFALIDHTRVTGSFSSTPTCGAPGAHAHSEENTLFGLSFRRGVFTLGAHGPRYVVTWHDHPYLKDTVPEYDDAGERVIGPPGLLAYETDGLGGWEKRSSPRGVFATGVDGSPRNFQVIAVAEIIRAGAPPSVARPWQSGNAVIGCFTNRGKVFAAGTTEWVKHLGDRDVATITANVLDDLKARKNEPLWDLPPRMYPGSTWTQVAKFADLADVPALVATLQGHLVTHRDHQFYRRDPENPGAADDAEPLAMSASPPFDLGDYKKPSCLGTDLWGYMVYAGTADGKIYSRPGNVHEPPPYMPTADAKKFAWLPLNAWIKGAEAVLGVATGLGPIFAVARVKRGAAGPRNVLFACIPLTDLFGGAVLSTKEIRFRDPTTLELGPMYPPVRAITYLDGHLFGVRESGNDRTGEVDLLVREASPLDLVWTKIGTVPAGTYAITAYFGRLYVLALPKGTLAPTLHWRSTVPDRAFPYGPPTMLFLRGSTAQRDRTRAFALAQLSSHGDVRTTGEGVLGFDYSLACRVNVPFVEPDLVAPWPPSPDPAPPPTMFLGTTRGRVFFLNNHDHSGKVVQFEADGTVHIVHEYDASSFGHWDIVMHFRCGDRDWNDPSVVREMILFYRRSDGAAVIGDFREDGTWRRKTEPGLKQGWTHIVATAKGDLFFYDRANGDCAVGRVNHEGELTAEMLAPLEPGWDHVAPIGNTHLILHRDVGSVDFRESPEKKGRPVNLLYCSVDFPGITRLQGYDGGRDGGYDGFMRNHVPFANENGVVLFYCPKDTFETVVEKEHDAKVVQGLVKGGTGRVFGGDGKGLLDRVNESRRVESDGPLTPTPGADPPPPPKAVPLRDFTRGERDTFFFYYGVPAFAPGWETAISIGILDDPRARPLRIQDKEAFRPPKPLQEWPKEWPPPRPLAWEEP